RRAFVRGIPPQCAFGFTVMHKTLAPALIDLLSRWPTSLIPSPLINDDLASVRTHCAALRERVLAGEIAHDYFAIKNEMHPVAKAGLDHLRHRSQVGDDSVMEALRLEVGPPADVERAVQVADGRFQDGISEDEDHD